MAIWTETEQQRPASGRFVRNLALSLSGGALLTLLGAGAAGAQDGGTAGTASDGAGAARSGDATAVGNRSGTTKSQTGTASGTMGNLQVVNQTAAVGNVGVAVANTGGNVAVGNRSVNNNSGTQTALNGLGPASNSGSVANSSNGTATVSTGDATAIGNQSTTNLAQTSGTAANGALNGILIVNQVGLVGNAGVALANTGGNIAVGNQSVNNGLLTQTASADQGLSSNSGKSHNASDGLATIYTGNASAVGNQSDTKVTQTSSGDAGDDPGGVLLVTQAGAVLNVGAGIANSGGNLAIGNQSVNNTVAAQDATMVNPNGLALLGVTSNSADASNVSDGSASIRTGDATAVGNESHTDLGQSGEGEADGIVPITQAALVVNGGIGVANSGLNLAVGNTATSNTVTGQSATTGGIAPWVAGTAITSNQLTSVSGSDGSASIHTGAADATGNSSHTVIDQGIDPNGLVLNPQIAIVGNLGLGIANSGVNAAVGNASPANIAAVGQGATVGGGGLLAGQTVASNSADVSNTSDGDASIHTGAASATGNDSWTQITQDANGAIDGMGVIVTPQVALVGNVGVAAANSGVNLAVGNLSTSNTAVAQSAETATGPGPYVAGSAIASNSASAGNESDASAEIWTGDATARGNVSATAISQTSDAAIDGMGVVLAPQVGVVLNAGAGLANSGVNAAFGNVSVNNMIAAQQALAGTVPQALVVLGPLTSSNSMSATNSSDGHAKVKTGDATAEGNRSTTSLAQTSDATVETMGIVVAPQLGGVANVGLGVANSGVNAAIGNISFNNVAVGQGTAFASGGPGFSGLVFGPATAANQGDFSNGSDGEACVCTGDAWASGNISSTTMTQDHDLSVGTGLVVVVEAGGVLNAGLGLANSGVNAAVGNSSDNTVSGNQLATINDALLGLPIVGPQTASSGLSAGNSSNGTALVGSGNATAIGNESVTDFAQAAAVDSDFAVTSIIGGTANAGAGLANSGLNIGVGNDSSNLAVLAQSADGGGIASNQGDVSNDSDGTAIIGDPLDCLDEEGKPRPETPGKPGLPRTGAELETQAAIGLMLLLLGFGLERRSRKYAFRA